MDDWRPATVDEVNQIVARDLKTCDAEQLAAFKTYQVEAFSAPIMRYGNGFNVSPIGADGTVLEHWCNARTAEDAPQVPGSVS